MSDKRYSSEYVVYPLSTLLVRTSWSCSCPTHNITTSGLTPHSFARVINVYRSSCVCLSGKILLILSLAKIILEETYKSDYEAITSKLLYEEVTYVETLAVLKSVIGSAMFN